MLRRAGIASVVALVAALLGFTGVLHNSVAIVRFVFYVVAAFSGLSLLFALFEETNSDRKGRHHTAALRD